MKLYWHIGPHKTGTTSLQLALAAHAASGRASFYYPSVGDYGPGHALLAWQLLGLNGRQRTPDVIHAAIEEAKRRGIDTVVLSSEEFSRAAVGEAAFEPIARVCADFECELILTLRPLAERLYPELQERVKHGEKIAFSSPHDLLTVFVDRPGMRPDFLSAAILGTGAQHVSVIMADRSAPEKLFKGLSSILGQEIPAARDRQENQSYPFIKTTWLEAINRFIKVPPDEARAAVEVGFHAASKRLKSLEAAPYPPIPPILQRYLDSTWQLQLAFLKVLEESGRVRIY